MDRAFWPRRNAWARLADRLPCGCLMGSWGRGLLHLYPNLPVLNLYRIGTDRLRSWTQQHLTRRDVEHRTMTLADHLVLVQAAFGEGALLVRAGVVKGVDGTIRSGYANEDVALLVEEHVPFDEIFVAGDATPLVHRRCRPRTIRLEVVRILGKLP